MTYGVVDLFCGVGGLTCGLEKAGLDVVAGYDLDATCEYTYSHTIKSIGTRDGVDIRHSEVNDVGVRTKVLTPTFFTFFLQNHAI